MAYTSHSLKIQFCLCHICHKYYKSKNFIESTPRLIQSISCYVLGYVCVSAIQLPTKLWDKNVSSLFLFFVVVGKAHRVTNRERIQNLNQLLNLNLKFTKKKCKNLIFSPQLYTHNSLHRACTGGDNKLTEGRNACTHKDDEDDDD